LSFQKSSIGRGIGLKVLTGHEAATAAAGKFVFSIFAAQAELKRVRLSERTRGVGFGPDAET